MTRKVLVTGGSGYIGSFLLRSLVADGIAVTAIVRPGRGLSGSANPALRVVEHDGSVGRMLSIVAAERPDTVFHLAAMGGADHSATDIDAMVQANVLLGCQIVEALRDTGQGVFVNTGTFWQHHGGTDTYAPTSLYAATKQAFEDVLVYYAEVAGVRALTLKLFDVYGARDPRRRLFSMLREAQRTGVPVALSPGDQQLDLVHIDDVVRAYRAAARLLHDGDAVLLRSYAVSGGVRHTLREAVAILEDVSGERVPVAWGARPYRAREVMAPYQGDALPGWAPEVSLRAGLGRLLREEPDLSPSGTGARIQ